MNGVSVIICCYNSANRIEKTLKHLSSQCLPPVPVEIIVVDNASKDLTKEVARKFWANNGNNQIAFKIVEELSPGLNNARERGVSEAIYNIGIFCDDDNWLFPDFVSKAYQQLIEDPTIGLIGSF